MFKIKNQIMRKVLALFLIMFPTVLAFSETEAIQRPVSFVSGLVDGIMSFLKSTIGWFALLILAVGFAMLITAVYKNVGHW